MKPVNTDRLLRALRIVATAAILALTACAPVAEDYLVPISTDSEQARRLYLEGRELIENRRLVEGRRRLTQAVEADPGFGLAHLALANSAAGSKELFGHLAQAVAAAEGVSAGEREMILGAEAGAKQDFVTQLACYTRLSEMFPEDERVQLLLGAFHLAQQDYREATTRLRRTTSLNPEFPPAYNLLGYAYRFQGQWVEAVWAFKTYIDLLPSEPSPYDSYAELLMKQGKFPEALATYREALVRDPQFVSARIGIGSVHMLDGRLDEARREFEQVLEQATDDGQRRQALLWTAASYVHAGDHASAVVRLEQMAALAEAGGNLADQSRDLDRIGDVLLEAGDLPGAEARYAEALAIMERADVPDEIKIAARRTRIYHASRLELARGDFEAARASARRFLREDGRPSSPGDQRRYAELEGRLALAEGDFEKAARQLSRGNQQDPQILYLAALANRGMRSPRARTLADKAAHYNGLDFGYAFVKSDAAALLAEIQSAD